MEGGHMNVTTEEAGHNDGELGLVVQWLSYLHEAFYSFSWGHNNCRHDTSYHPGIEMLR